MNNNTAPAEIDIVTQKLTSEFKEEDTEEGDRPEDDRPEDDRPEEDVKQVMTKSGRFPAFWHRLKRAIFLSPEAENTGENFREALKNGKHIDRAFSSDEQIMLDNILLMREVRVEDVMVPRADIEAVDRSISLGELLAVFEASGHSRMPVFSDNLDDPKGMVHIKDLLTYFTRQARNGRRNTAKNSPLKTSAKPFDFTKIKLDKTLQEANIIRKVLFVPASMLASDLLKRMQAMRTQMALVIDEYGGTDGLVSLEDIVEIVVGDIEDEHDDVDASPIIEISDGVWEADAKAGLDELSTILGTRAGTKENSDDVDTMGGLIFARLGRVPVRGEVIRMVQGFEFHIIDADARRIKRIRILKLKAHPRRRTGKINTG